MMSGGLDLDDLCRRAKAIVDEARSAGSLAVDVEVADAMPTVARSLELLRSAVTLAEAETSAAIGLIARALFEEWLFTLLWIDGTNDDRSRLVADYFHHAERLADKVDAAPPLRPEGVQPKQWGVWSRAQRLDELLGTQRATEIYDLVFRIESLASAHGGIGARGRHLRIVEDRPVIDAVGHDPAATIGRLAIAVILVGEMCSRLWAAAGRDTTRFDLAADVPFS